MYNTADRIHPMNTDFPPLDTECSKCGGQGEFLDDLYSPPREMSCHECHGHDRIPTPFGEEVLAFVSARLRLKTSVG